MSQTTLNRGVTAAGILNANSRHFIPLSLLFFPVIFSAYQVTNKLYSSSSSPNGNADVITMFDPFNFILIKTIFASASQNLLTVKTLTTVFTFICFAILPTVAGVALITYSTNQAIQRKPITFSSTLKSLSHSYIPLLHTFNAGSITLIIIFLAFTLSQLALTKALEFHFGLSIVIINIIFSYALAMIIFFFLAIWGSAAAITVLESKSGFEALRQSANQSTTEFRRYSFSIVLMTGYLILPALYSSTLFKKSGLMLILQVGAIFLESSLMILLYVVANTILYVQFKIASQEGAATTTVKPEVTGEYVTLVVNDNDGDGEVVDQSANGSFSYILILSMLVSLILILVSLFALLKEKIYD